jgi:hypothetical protein
MFGLQNALLLHRILPYKHHCCPCTLLTTVPFQNFMAEAAAASPGHNFDSIPPYLPSPRSPRAKFLTTSYTGRESGVTEQRLQMIY